MEEIAISEIAISEKQKYCLREQKDRLTREKNQT